MKFLLSRVFKNISQVSPANEWNIFQNERHDLLCNHSSGDLFMCEDIMFLRKSSPGISLVFIIIIKCSL